MSKTATYKGRTYLVKFTGTTKFGHKAKLAFMDGSKEFWVPLDAITLTGGGGSSYTPRAHRPSRMRTCPRCGGNEANQVECGECA